MKFAGLAAALALAAALSGCNGEPEPKFTDPSESPTTDSTKASSPTDEPKGRKAQERAFIRKFLNEFETSTTTGETESMLRMTADTCGNCTVIARNIRRAFRNGGRVKSEGFTVARLERTAHKPRSSYWKADLKWSEQTWLDGKSEVVNVVAPESKPFGVIVVNRRGTLLIEEFGPR